MSSSNFILFSESIDKELKAFPLSASIKAYIVYFLMNLVLLPFYFYLGWRQESDPFFFSSFMPALIALGILGLVVSTIANIGFIRLALEYEKRFFGFVTLASILFSFLLEIPNIFIQLNSFFGNETSSTLNMLFYVITFLPLGVISIVWGASLFQVRREKLFTFIAVYSIIVGLLEVSLILAIITPFLAVPLFVLEIYLLKREKDVLGIE